VWDLERDPATLPERMGGEEGGQPRYVAAGEYTISLKYGERPPLKTKLVVEALPGVHAGEVGGE
jgi:hypothetical protein